MKPSYRDEKSPTIGLKRAPKRSSNERLCVHACIQQCTRGYTTVYTRVHKRAYDGSTKEEIASRRRRGREDGGEGSGWRARAGGRRGRERVEGEGENGRRGDPNKALFVFLCNYVGRSEPSFKEK